MQRLILVLLVVLGLLGPSAWAADRPGPFESLEQAAEVDDPRALVRAADHWRDNGRPELAEGLYQKAFEQQELSRYFSFRPAVAQALLDERMGRVDEAAAGWRAGFVDNVQDTLLALQMASIHPQREALFEEGVAHVRALVEQARRGEDAVIYTTSKGSPRHLEVIPDDEAVRRIREAPGGRLRYCYIDELDFSKVPPEDLPEEVFLLRCVVGRVVLPERHISSFRFKGIALGDFDLGKTWTGQPNASAAIPGSTFDTLMILESVFLGAANFQEVKVSGRLAYFALSTFGGPADFRDTVFDGMADFRFSVFGGGANFKQSHFSDAVYMGHTRYLDDTTFRGMYSEQDVYLNSARFEGAARFDRCEWARGLTLENSRFDGPVTFLSSELGGRLNMSRTIFSDTLQVKEMQLGGMDFIGSWLKGDASFVDVLFHGKVRFSLDDITRATHLDDPTPLLPLYRDYQGDKDAPEPLTTRNSYGVEHVDDLIARIDGNLSFANSVFRDFCVFERVQFGLPGQPSTALFYNTQFKGESHFERTAWHSVADFSTIFANELSFNEAFFHHSLVLDDAYVAGRITLTDADFAEGADVSFYGAEFSSFQVNRAHVEIEEDGEHRLFYKHCAQGDPLDGADTRVVRMRRSGLVDEGELRADCHERAIDEYVTLKSSFGDRAMTTAEDWAYWSIKHTEMMKDIRHGSLLSKAGAMAMVWPVFEVGFGWGVRLGNLGVTLIVITLLFAWLYRVACPNTVVQYNGDDVPLRDVPWHGLIFISLQSLGAFNTGWDFGEDDTRFQYLNTVETFLGIIILTFFVGAYTRMILA